MGRENSELLKKIVQLESCMDEEAAWIGKTTAAIRGQFRNMNMRIRPRKMREANILEQELPQLNAHARAPSAVFTPMYTPTQRISFDSHQWTSHNCIQDKTHFKPH